MKKRGQAALEFLVTYSWAFLAILISLGSLYYFGLLDFQKYLPDRCLLSNQIECLDFVMKGPPDNKINIKLVNNLGEQINVQSVDITNDANSPLTCTNASVGFDWNAGDEKDFPFSACSGGGFLPGERLTAKISLTYYAVNTPSQPLHTVSGSIQGRIQ